MGRKGTSGWILSADAAAGESLIAATEVLLKHALKMHLLDKLLTITLDRAFVIGREGQNLCSTA